MTTDEGRAVLCLVTDRRRLAAAIAGADLEWRAALIEQIRGAIAGGVDAIYLREYDLDARTLASLARDILPLCRRDHVDLLVGDRLDVALATSASGVHLPQHGLPLAATRRLAPAPFLVGRSVHDAAAAAASRDASHLMAGHVFDTVSKRGVVPMGRLGLEAIVQAASPCPVWAIGGITADNASTVVAAGARGVASIGAFIPEAAGRAIEAAAHDLTVRLRAGLQARPLMH